MGALEEVTQEGAAASTEEPGALLTASVFCPKLAFYFVKTEIPYSASFFAPVCPAGVYHW